MPKPRTWRLLSKKWSQIASGVLFIDLAILAAVGTIYPNANPFLYASGILVVAGLLTILGAIISLIASSSPPDDQSTSKA